MYKKLLAVILSAVILASAAFSTASAFSYSSEFSIEWGSQDSDKGYTLQRISNPESTLRMADGLIEGGDRETSYVWCMEDRGDYVYIGTNKDIGGLVVDGIGSVLMQSGLSAEIVQDLSDVFSNGEVPHAVTEEGGYILRCDKNTGEIVKLYTAPKNVSFRMAIRHGDNIYFGSYASDGVSSNDILRIDTNDNIETVFSSTNGTSMRAACTMGNNLYFGGVDESIQLGEGDEDCMKMAILCKDNNDDSIWNRVADYRDFGRLYAADEAVRGAVTSPIWDLCSFRGDIYATIPNSGGFAMFKGHPAKTGETANEYGWCWQEVIGYNNIVNNIGLCDDPAGYQGVKSSMISVTGTPFVFNDELYVMDFDNTSYSMIYAVSGLLAQITSNTGKPGEYLRAMYETMRHQQSIWRMNNETGKFEKSEGFAKASVNPCTEYLWRSAVYDGELYVTTMDSATIYNYITRLTNGNFVKMTPEERSDMLNYIKKLVTDIVKSTNDAGVEAQSKGILDSIESMFSELSGMKLNSETVSGFVSKFEDVKENVKTMIASAASKLAGAKNIAKDTVATLISSLSKLKSKAVELYNSIDWEGLKMYAYISNAVRDDVWGFEMYKTADGENYEAVTIDGFGNKYNYGGRTLLATDKGLYIGTANPFYGAQLWRLTNNHAPDDSATEPAKSIKDCKVSAFKSLTYNGKARTQSIKVTDGSKTLKKGTDYTVTYVNNKNAGKATAVIMGKGAYDGFVKKTFTIKKANNTIKVKAVKKTVKLSTLKKKSVTVTALKVTGAKGKKAFARVTSKKSKFTVNKTTGKITIKKGTKKGTYKFKVKVTAKGTSNYKSKSKTVTVKITVK